MTVHPHQGAQWAQHPVAASRVQRDAHGCSQRNLGKRTVVTTHPRHHSMRDGHCPAAKPPLIVLTEAHFIAVSGNLTALMELRRFAVGVR
jgi:hypothetical protein